MAVYDIYSKRQNRLIQGEPDIYIYDDIPEKLRIQIKYLIDDCLPRNSLTVLKNKSYNFIYESLCREYGRAKLTNKEYYHYDDFDEIIFNLLNQANIEEIWDLIEFIFTERDILDQLENNIDFDSFEISLDEAIQELNHRFLEHGVGYQLAENSLKIIRVDSQYLHQEVVCPVLKILSQNMYRGAEEEFLIAHEHYRKQRNKECLIFCSKSLESLIKTICNKHSWSYTQNDTAKRLIQVCFDNNLISTYMESQFTSLRSVLESGVSTIRSKEAAHGQGAVPVQVDDHLARYALNLTASNLLFLAECEQQLDKP